MTKHLLSWLREYIQNRLRAIAKGAETNAFTEYATLLTILNHLRGR